MSISFELNTICSFILECVSIYCIYNKPTNTKYTIIKYLFISLRKFSEKSFFEIIDSNLSFGGNRCVIHLLRSCIFRYQHSNICRNKTVINNNQSFLVVYNTYLYILNILKAGEKEINYTTYSVKYCVKFY